MIKSAEATVSQGILTDKSTLKLAIVTSVSMIVGVIAISSLACSDNFSLELDTIRYFLSSVFTGLAAFLAIVLVVVGIEYGRLVASRNSLAEELDSHLQHLCISTLLLTDIEDYDQALRDWHADRYPDFIENAKEISSAIANDALDSGKCSQFDGLSQTMLFYRRAGRRLGRFRVENARFRRLPWGVAGALVPAGLTVLVSGLILACLEPLASAMPDGNPTYMTIAVSLMLMFSMVLIFSLLYSIFSRLASEDYQYWFKRSGLSDLTELDKLLKEMSDKVTEHRKTAPR